MNNKPTTICMFSNLYHPVASGSSLHLSNLSRELVRCGCKVIIITAHVEKKSKAYEIDNGIHIYRLPSIRLPKMPISLNFPWLTLTFTPNNLKQIEQIIDKHTPDVFHLHNHMFDLAFSAVVMKKKKKVPLVVTNHTIIKHSRLIYNLILYPLDRFFLRATVINNADVIICPDLNSKNYIRDAFKKRNTLLIPYGIELPKAPSERNIEQIKKKYKLHGKKVILSLGHVHEIRNRKDLIEAMPMILKEHPNTVLLIVGEVTTKTPELLANKLGIQQSLILAGSVPYDDIPAFFAVADMESHWLNQDDPEKTSPGIAFLEAMYAGKVVIAAANEESYGTGILKSGHNCILVKMNDPFQLANTITSLLNDRKQCELIGDHAHETIKKHFSWKNICEKTIQIYNEVIQKI